MAYPTNKLMDTGKTQETILGIRFNRRKRKTASPIDLYMLAEEKGLDVDWIPMQYAASLSAELPSGTLCIAIDPWKMDTVAKETVALGHELGHCVTGAFYNRYATRDVMQKHENHADKWAIKRLVPVDKLDEAVADGHTEIWDLAEYFGVTEDFMRKAVCWYAYGNLATELYF